MSPPGYGAPNAATPASTAEYDAQVAAAYEAAGQPDPYKAYGGYTA
jgi:hypothetical protein